MQQPLGTRKVTSLPHNLIQRIFFPQLLKLGAIKFIGNGSVCALGKGLILEQNAGIDLLLLLRQSKPFFVGHKTSR